MRTQGHTAVETVSTQGAVYTASVCSPRWACEQQHLASPIHIVVSHSKSSCKVHIRLCLAHAKCPRHPAPCCGRRNTTPDRSIPRCLFLEYLANGQWFATAVSVHKPFGQRSVLAKSRSAQRRQYPTQRTHLQKGVINIFLYGNQSGTASGCGSALYSARPTTSRPLSRSARTGGAPQPHANRLRSAIRWSFWFAPAPYPKPPYSHGALTSQANVSAL